MLTLCIANVAAYEVDDAVLQNLREYALANSLFWALAEGHACEISVGLSPSRGSIDDFTNEIYRLVAMLWTYVFHIHLCETNLLDPTDHNVYPRTPPRTLVK